VTARVNQIYDDELKRRVALFQQGEALMPDGIAGEETLVRLVATAPGATGPTLNGERP
jgi:murein L,D-transpeptidase YcbB/YkuD